MKKKILIAFFCLFGIIILLGTIASKEVESSFIVLNDKIKKTYKDGDIIFQTSQSEQCEAVRIATNSKFSHCGIIFIENDKTYVYEAVQPVKVTLLEDWIEHGKDNKYVVKRIKNSEQILTTNSLQKMKKYATTQINKDYDVYFIWSDKKIYCSELVWKIYKEGASIEICNLQKLKEFNLIDPKVKAILKERYGNTIPYEELVVAPSQIEKSPKLITIFDNY
jgi:uncharacterized protein YycO